MRPSPLLLALAVLVAACGGNSAPPAATKCPQKPCGTGLTCQSDGTCAAVSVAPDGGTVPTCDASAKPVVTSSAVTPPDTVIPLGQATVGTDLHFTVPANTVGIQIVEQAVSAPDAIVFQVSSTSVTTIPNVAVPVLVKDSGGTTWYDDTQPLPADGSSSLGFYAGGAAATGTFTLPNTSAGLALAGPFKEGIWSLRVGDYAYECSLSPGSCPSGSSSSSRYDVSVVLKTASPSSALPSSGKLDVNVYLATTAAPNDSGVNVPLSADTANAQGDQDLLRMENSYRTILGKAGIDVGTFTYHLLGADTLSTYATGIDADPEGACAPIPQLLRNGTTGNTMNVFFVSRFKSTQAVPGHIIVGLDGTIPGPSTFGGTVASGVAVSTADLRAGSGTTSCTSGVDYFNCGADETAYFIAHETGHFLGLYHTTEFDGTAFDPIADSSKCPCSSCAKLATGEQCGSGSGTTHPMDETECSVSSSCGGADNLMFWLISAKSSASISPNQAAVLRSNPLILF